VALTRTGDLLRSLEAPKDLPARRLQDFRIAVYPAEWCLWPVYQVSAGYYLNECFAVNLGPIRISWRWA
jgi:hypothetical protein